MTDEELIARLDHWIEQQVLVLVDSDLLPIRDRIEALTAKLAKAVEALLSIDALDPEALISGCSREALGGLVNLMGDKARATLAEIKGT